MKPIDVVMHMAKADTDAKQNRDFRPLLPRQRLAAGKAQLEMEVNSILRRIETGNATAEDARTLRHAFATLVGRVRRE